MSNAHNNPTQQHADIAYSPLLEQARQLEREVLLLGLLAGLRHEDALDNTQEALVNFWLTYVKKGVPIQTKVRTVFRRIARNGANRRLAARRQWPSLDEGFGSEEPVDHGSQGHDPDLAEILATSIKQLPIRQRLAITMRFLEDKSYKAIAEELGTTPHAIAVRIGKGLERLAEILGRRGYP